jgi:hypothetical protein
LASEASAVNPGMLIAVLSVRRLLLRDDRRIDIKIHLESANVLYLVVDLMLVIALGELPG